MVDPNTIGLMLNGYLPGKYRKFFSYLLITKIIQNNERYIA